MKVYVYDKCSTCRRALTYLKATGRSFEVAPIRARPPAKAELRRMLKVCGGKLAGLFNTSGTDYRAMKLSARLKTMSVEQALDLLAKNGNLVKRPFLLVGNTGVTGFDV